MPVPTHIFDPPFNIIRCSHVVLDVTRSEREPRVLRDHRRPACRGPRRQGGLPARQRGASASLAGAAQGARRPPAAGSASRSATRTISTRPPLLLGERHHLRLRRAAVPGPHAAVHRSRSASRSNSTLDGEAPASAAALRSLQGLPSAAARPFQRLRRRRAGHRRLLRAARLPADRIWRGRRTERAHRRGLDAPQGQRARLRLHQRPRPAPAPFRLLGADRDEHPAPLRRDGLQRLS